MTLYHAESPVARKQAFLQQRNFLPSPGVAKAKWSGQTAPFQTVGKPAFGLVQKRVCLQSETTGFAGGCLLYDWEQNEKDEKLLLVRIIILDSCFIKTPIVLQKSKIQMWPYLRSGAGAQFLRLIIHWESAFPGVNKRDSPSGIMGRDKGFVNVRWKRAGNFICLDDSEKIGKKLLKFLLFRIQYCYPKNILKNKKAQAP